MVIETQNALNSMKIPVLQVVTRGKKLIQVLSDPYETLRAAKNSVLVTLQFVFLTLNFSKLSTENPYLAQNLSTDPLRPYP